MSIARFGCHLVSLHKSNPNSHQMSRRDINVQLWMRSLTFTTTVQRKVELATQPPCPIRLDWPRKWYRAFETGVLESPRGFIEAASVRCQLCTHASPGSERRNHITNAVRRQRRQRRCIRTLRGCICLYEVYDPIWVV